MCRPIAGKRRFTAVGKIGSAIKSYELFPALGKDYEISFVQSYANRVTPFMQQRTYTISTKLGVSAIFSKRGLSNSLRGLRIRVGNGPPR